MRKDIGEKKSLEAKGTGAETGTGTGKENETEKGRETGTGIAKKTEIRGAQETKETGLSLTAGTGTGNGIAQSTEGGGTLVYSPDIHSLLILLAMPTHGPYGKQAVPGA